MAFSEKPNFENADKTLVSKKLFSKFQVTFYSWGQIKWFSSEIQIKRFGFKILREVWKSLLFFLNWKIVKIRHGPCVQVENVQCGILTQKWRSICLQKYECSCKKQIPHFNLTLASFFLLKNESEDWNNFFEFVIFELYCGCLLLSFTQLRSAELLTQWFDFEFTKPCSKLELHIWTLE